MPNPSSAIVNGPSGHVLAKERSKFYVHCSEQLMKGTS